MSVTSEAPAAFRNAAARPTPLGLLTEAIRDISSRRRLVRYLVQAEIKKRGANTLLGNIWWILDPLLLMVVYVVLVTIITTRALPDYPLFIFAAILPWKWFTAAVTDATGSIVNHHRLIKQIAFPKIVLPVAATTAGVVGFAFGLIPLAAIMLLYPHRLTPLILLIPIIAVVQYVFTVAVAILVAAGNVFFRDLGNVVRHLLRLWWYLSPGLYALSHLDGIALFENPVLRFIAHANPFAVLFEAYRSVIYGTPQGSPMPPDWASLAILFVASTVFLAIASVAFKRLEPTFAKVL
ncbi:MAG: ABC transporter permease [Chloroflexota bacterium]|jgi:ABC-type polysaccharide/polyol phosphate export permease|nr:ABC transporter permease [Chloroflexota bacterium]